MNKSQFQGVAVRKQRDKELFKKKFKNMNKTQIYLILTITREY